MEKSELLELKGILEGCDNVLILTHKSPDGDTLGCGFALCNYLRDIGKKANVLNSENFPVRYNFLYDGYYVQKFEPEFVIAVDVADVKLLGSHLSSFMEEGKIDLCIDHHISNKFFAKKTFLDARASAAALIFYEYFKAIDYKISDQIALCLYTAIATDTGCFKYQNTIPEAHMAAADLMQYNIGFETVNRRMFDVKSKGRIKAEQQVIANMEYHFDDKCTMIVLTQALMNSVGAEPAEFDGLASIPLEIEGVAIGITIKERHPNVYKLSVRTTEEVDASAFCRTFGGGGHIRAAGCEINATLDEVRQMVLKAVAEHLGVEYEG
ncbi:MAG: bifunctional oligoribonuclease/PAP phosphatase NrnA [Ruminococcus sp.]|nr:bifunctional oligoribonuclease/PAP phosphatase NrnA [Ruminococcus sp.]